MKNGCLWTRRLLMVGITGMSSLVGAQAWMNTALSPKERADLLVGAMTLDQKIQQIKMAGGTNPDLPGCGAGGRHLEGIPALQIPTHRMTNGPTGVAGGDCSTDRMATAVPANFVAVASFDPTIFSMWGDITGQEVRANGHHGFLAPGMNMGRVPNLGRNFEYMGEDPYLTGLAGAAMARAIQAHGVITVAKHYLANEQETNRQTVNTIIDDRTLRELYLLPFEMAIKDGDLTAMMCSYPRINGTFTCENTHVMKTVLRDQLGWDGYVMSDRGAAKSTAPSILAGLNVEFPGSNFYTPANVNAALAAGQITVADIDNLLKPRYIQMFKLGQFDNPIVGVQDIDFTDHGIKARQMAEQGSVLLKNANNFLPLKAASIQSIAVIGPQRFAGAAKLPGMAPGGNVFVRAPYTVTPQQGLQNVLASLGSSATVTFNNGTNIASAAALAAASDVAIVMVGDLSVEGSDRATLALPTVDNVNQEALIAAVAAATPRTVVVLKNGGPVLMPWLSSVPAVLEAWYPGQEDGNAVANLLFGVVNPSGKLPITFPSVERIGATATVEQFPGVNINGVPTVTYTEKLEMGYRWYDAHFAQPLFPFGYGLSYTTFAFSDIVVTPKISDGTQPIKVRFSLQNTGPVAGAEVPQVYLQLPLSLGEPPRRLVGFQKVFLQPGEKKQIEVTINPAASNHPLGYWDTAKQAWTTISGAYGVTVGTSSKNLVGGGLVKVLVPAGS
jgi:beta-glucosidase